MAGVDIVGMLARRNRTMDLSTCTKGGPSKGSMCS
jgi:hypothetical protein